MEEDSDSSLISKDTISDNNDAISNEQKAIDFVTEFYNNHDYEDYAFLEKHCSPEMLKELQDDYEYKDG